MCIPCMETIYQFKTLNRDYDDFTITPTISPEIDPISNKLFSGDEFSFSEQK